MGHERDHVQLLVLDHRPRWAGRARRPIGIAPSFAFPENATPELAPDDWQPRYHDYLYLSFTNATAFSPTDTLPIQAWAKMAMMAESVLSLLTAIMVIARAINILPNVLYACRDPSCRDPDERRRGRGEAKDRRTKIIEIIEVSVLSIVAILTAWSGYQGTKWGGFNRCSTRKPRASRLQAEALSTHAGQMLVADATIFTAWLEAHHAHDTSLEAELERRFTPEYHDAFTSWLATDPFTHPDAPPGPGAMPGFTTAEFQQAASMNDQASALLADGTDARDTANEYIRATVLFASVLLLVCEIAQRFSVHGVRIAANVLALVLLSYAVWSVARLPSI